MTCRKKKEASWNYPGARWWKFDFHTHTPASKDTAAWQQAIGTSDELMPEQWLLEYMAAEIDCVAITDHNSGAWIDKLKAAYGAMQDRPPPGFRELYLFPGVEISVNGGFHLLAIFETNATTSEIDSLLGRVDYSGTKGASDGVTRRSATDVVHAVLEAGALPIPAHADGSKGLLQLQATDSLKSVIDHPTLQQVLGNARVLCMEVVNPAASKPSSYSQAKLKWAEVVGSDCHTFQGTAVPGSRYTWIKMARPSLEGLRLALLDGQDVSIRRSDDAEPFSAFERPEHFIESIRIADARWMGRQNGGEQLKFNPCFNALVGGRGTGKSTVIHALRLAYRREHEPAQGSEARETFARFNKVAKNPSEQGGLRTDTRIELIVSRDGIRHRLLWSQDEQASVVEEWDDGTSQWKTASSQVITAQRFRLRLFSQGQIAALAENQEALLKVIDEAAGMTTEQAAFAEAKRSFLATRARQRELDGKLKGREALNLSLQDVQRKLARFEAAHHAQVLRAYQRSSRQTRELDRQFAGAAELAARLRALADDLLAEDLPDGLFDPDEDGDALLTVQSVARAIAQARAQVVEIAALLAQRSSTLRAQFADSVWQSKVDAAGVAYQVLKTGLQAQGVNDPSEYGRLVQEKQSVELEGKRLDALQKQFDQQRLRATAELENVQQARRAMSNKRAEFLRQTLASNHFVRMDLVPYGRDAQTIERSLRELLGTPDNRFKEDVYVEAPGDGQAQGLVADLLRSVVLVEEASGPDRPQFEASIRRLQERLERACDGSNEFGARFNKYLAGEAGKRPEFVDHIACWFPEDGLQVDYSRKGDGRDFQSIGQASAGQRAAAMLAFLLAHGDEPLVLDQPEDDLDNHLIYDLVVQQIRANKQRRQLIIVTHNPNIVVNGDAEMIYVLDFNKQCHVKRMQSGSLQDRAVRDEVCKVMEGGKDAFERRYQRLGREI
ncbi:chromosome segregation protein SMC [Candidatus Accumulibacter phosphatis]|uniref:Chromosome segregation protein SMC n=1 Tax=Candidatus Accumulibacter phosphatis TaxID=327160 RepID=A0ABX1U126_9PROT|nr:chromosome segregation protein SMC [Candidatus Accumulibacter phosphatis]